MAPSNSQAVDHTDFIVDVIVPYAPSVTPEQMFTEAVESAEQQSVETNLIVVKDTEQKGPAWARNRGIERSDNRYIAFLDADDLWTENKLSRQLRRMQETGAGICIEGEPKSPPELVSGLLYGDVESVTSSIILDTNEVCSRFNENLDRFEDHLFVIEAALESGVCFCENLVIIRKHDSGLSAQGDAKLMYDQRRRLAAQLEQLEELSADELTTFKRILHYKATVQFRKNNQFLQAGIAGLRSLRYGLSYRNIRAIAALPVFACSSVIKDVIRRT